MLTDANRTFLQGDRSGYTRQAQKDHRDRIRERVGDTFHDFTILVNEWPEEERKKAIDEFFTKDVIDSNPVEAVSATVALAFETARQRGLTMEQITKPAAETAIGQDVADNMRVHSSVEISNKILETGERAPPAASAADKLRDGMRVTELTTEEQALVLRYVDDQDLTTDEVDGEDLLNWWMELGKE